MTTNEKPTNPGIGYILLQRRLTEMEKQMEQKDAVIARQQVEINALLESGIHLRGWWCHQKNQNGVSCDTFNGQEKEEFEECRRCGNIKPPKVITSAG